MLAVPGRKERHMASAHLSAGKALRQQGGTQKDNTLHLDLCTPSEVEEDMYTAIQVCRARGPTDKNNEFATSEVISSLHEFASL